LGSGKAAWVMSGQLVMELYRTAIMSFNPLKRIVRR
jgi:hypothetical protein